MKTYFFLAALCVTLLFACKNGNSPGQHQDSGSPAIVVKLDNGQKWHANKETTEGIQKMILLSESLPGQASLEDYHSLKTNLAEELDSILRKCTMKGEAHHQLHKYLMPLREIIERLGLKSLEKTKVASVELKQYLKEYSQYFE